MTNQTIRILIFVVLLLHGLGHMGAMIGMVYHHQRNSTGDWLSDRSWLIPSMPTATAKIVAGILWGLAWTGFVAAALAFLGILIPGESWRFLAVASAILSGIGIVLFFGSWPLPNTIAAQAINLGVLVTQFGTRWPPETMFGN